MKRDLGNPLLRAATGGYLMIWILDKIIAMLKKPGYKHKGKQVWSKLTKKGKPVNGSGVTARHSTKTFYIFSRGTVKGNSRFHKMNDLVLAAVQGESIKPGAIAERILQLVPNGYFLEIFAHHHNLQLNYVQQGELVCLRLGRTSCRQV